MRFSYGQTLLSSITRSFGYLYTRDFSYLFLEFVPGGELLRRIRDAVKVNQTTALPIAEARLYAAEIVCALEYIHGWRVAYRDLKPENVLLDRDGHVRLVDLGCARQWPRASPSSLFGTRAYLAPEVVCGNDSGFSADWWALGVVIFEMIVGKTPFAGGNADVTSFRIVNWPLQFPATWPTERGAERNFISRLLDKDPSARLGGTDHDGASVVRQQPFFAALDWDACARRELRMPWRPSLVASTDGSQFATSPPSTPANSIDQSAFDGF